MRFRLYACGVSAAVLSAVQADIIVESLRGVPTSWTKVRNASPGQSIKLRVALEQPNLGLFEQTLYDISTPGHAQYGQHLKRDQVRELMKPKTESTTAVLTWLSAAGIADSQIEDDGEWINIRTTVGEADSLLSTKFAVFNHDGTKVNRVRALNYSVPETVRPHITMIQPITRFGEVQSQRTITHDITRIGLAKDTIKAAMVPPKELNVTACNATITPECLRALYKVNDYKAELAENSLFGVCGYLDEYAKYDQMTAFLSTYAPYANASNFSTALINGGKNDQDDFMNDDTEANLDIQYAAALSFRTNIRYYSTAGRGPLVPDLDAPDPDDSENEPYLDFLDYMSKLPDDELPQTLTTSYGENEQSVPAEYVKKVCILFGQLGARGVSVIFSSGDTGVSGACQTNDGRNTTHFTPIFPAACPYVTSVGATGAVDPEVALDFSSGGFSDLFARPAYQDAAVAGYLKKLGTRWSGLYNAQGRGFPDVAAQGRKFHFFDQGMDALASGTSASAPTFAAIISLLNNARLKNGQKPLGFLNPWLYSEGFKGLTDIIHGGSTGCTGSDPYSGLETPYVPYASWNATEGWDPVTGLGTPLFDKLLEISSPDCELSKIRDHGGQQ